MPSDPYEPDGLADMAEAAWARGDISDAEFEAGLYAPANGWSLDYAPENVDDAYAPDCEHLSLDDPITEAQLLTGARPREWTVRCEDCGRTVTRRRNDHVE